MRLFLFDIDGTLVTARGAGREAFNRALRDVFGTVGPVEAGYDFRGKTDPRILHDLMSAAGFEAAEIDARAARFFAAYARSLADVIGDGHRIEVMPGIPGSSGVLARLTRNALTMTTDTSPNSVEIRLIHLQRRYVGS